MLPTHFRNPQAHHRTTAVTGQGGGLAEIEWDTQLGSGLVRSLLLDEPPLDDPQPGMTLLGIDADQEYMAFRARGTQPGQNLDVLTQEIGVPRSVKARSGGAVDVEGDLVGFLRVPPVAVRRCVVGLGPSRRADRLAESFRLASRALDVAQAFGLSGVHSFDTLGLLPTILADSDVGEALGNRYLRSPAGADLPSDVLDTVRAHFVCAMNVEQTASAMLLHANTVRNRLVRFEQLTGASLREPVVAMEVWWALHREALAGRRTTVTVGAGPAEPVSRLPLAGPRCSSVRVRDRPVTSRQQAEFLRGLLQGTLGPAELSGQMSLHGIDDGREYYALRARPSKGGTLDELARAHGFSHGSARAGGLGAVVSGDLVGFLAEPPTGEVPGVSGIGLARPLDRLSESFRMASRALETAESCGRAGVCGFGDLGVLSALRSDRDVGEALYRRYLEPLGVKDFADEVVDTLKVYLREGKRIARTAERVFVHPNTVRYRISRFEELTGASLRDNLVVFEVLGALAYRSARIDNGPE
jgi:sugar diacid utilization regulator